ncbi:hypothetical protein B0E53_06991 [Micromonospora sp. MH33]|nr:hypothetical protein B0E53_06991 [Micromonospora sp. MH33]
MTPPSHSCSSYARKPCTRAATDWPMAATSTTSTTGLRSAVATAAVDSVSGRPAIES